MMKRTVATLLSAMLAVGTPAIVSAQDADASVEAQFKDLTTEASQAYEEERYEEATQLFKKAYEIKPVSNILYNIARIYEEAGDMDAAIEYYDKFVVAPNVEKDARKDALDRLKTLREVRALKESEETEVAEKPEEEPEEEPQPEPEPEPTTTERRPSTARTVGWVFLGVGGASLVGAGVFGLLAQGEFTEFESADSLEARRSAASQGRTNAVVADSLLVAGAVTGIVGGVLLIVSASGGEESPRTATNWSVNPLLGRDAAGVGLEIDF